MQLRDQLKSNLSEIAETHLEGKTYTPAERANSVRRGTGHWKPTNDKINQALDLNEISCEINTEDSVESEETKIKIKAKNDQEDPDRQ